MTNIELASTVELYKRLCEYHIGDKTGANDKLLREVENLKASCLTSIFRTLEKEPVEVYLGMLSSLLYKNQRVKGDHVFLKNLPKCLNHSGLRVKIIKIVNYSGDMNTLTKEVLLNK